MIISKATTSRNVCSTVRSSECVDGSDGLDPHQGIGRVGCASQGTNSPNWMMRQEQLSPCYITHREDLLVAR
ncbi:DUF4113 domain-containing protein [Buttiauxella gaviniae]|uniref:DUF4113 domain-containing protein n=1 Tax=Buttiauxella gaviniae TaxID=82990 RepID=UPI003BB65E21